jgi:long-chain acyl-CoA synthetase
MNEKQLFESLYKDFVVNGKLIFAGTLLKRAFERYANNIAVTTPQKNLSYKELYFRSILLTQKLIQSGVKPHDRVLLFYENSCEFFIAYFAIWQAGAVVVPVNIFLHEKELVHIVNDAAPATIIASPTLKEKLEALVITQQVSSLPPLLSNNDFDWTTPVPSIQDPLFANFKINELDQDDLCVLLYTSGTTGVPKGVMLSSKNVITNAIQDHARFICLGMKTEERFFCVLPLFHVFAQNTCLWLPTMIGATVIVVSKIDRALIIEGLKQKPTIFFGFPALYGLLCLMKTAPLDSIKIFISGADMLPDKIRYGFSVIYGRKICAGYGLTEASPVVAVNHENNTKATIVVGDPLIGLSCDIRNDEGKSLAPNEIGTLWLKGDNIMMGYYNAPEATAKILIDGWLNTGDLAYIDNNGKLAICGRIKDIIIHKGFNIYPAEVENVLLKHPAVSKAAVIGQEEAMSGQVPVAFVAIKERGAHIEKDLRALCAHNLAAYKVPRKFICLDDLPMNATGKVDKKQLINRGV